LYKKIVPHQCTNGATQIAREPGQTSDQKIDQVSQKIVSKISTRFETFSKSVLADLGTVFGQFFDPRSCPKGVITGLGLQILAQEAPKGSQEATKTLRKGSRGLPRAPLEVPKRRPRVSQDDPRRALVGFSRPPRGSERLSRLSPAIFGRISLCFFKVFSLQ
jgi:hypothetical protein